MKILKLTTLLDFGGQEKQYISFTEKPQLLRHEYIFIAIGYGGNAENILKERGFKVYILNQNFSIKHLLNIWTIYKLIKKIKPDIVHTAAAEANFHGLVAGKLAGVKTIIAEEIGIPNHSSVAKKIFRLIYKLSNKVIGVSQSVKNFLVHSNEIPEQKGKVIYNPVSIPKEFPKKKSHQFEIVFVGRLEQVKNVTILIKALSKIEIPNIHLTIVGDGREKENLEQLCDELNQKNRITFTGFYAEPSEYLCSADLFVLPSFSEGFGIAAVEAMMMKVPVLCSNVGGIPEFINDGVNGWLFNPNNENELIVKLEMILNLNKNNLHEIAQKGYDSVIEKFTVEKYIHNLETFYDEYI